jgi:hypothetical protein
MSADRMVIDLVAGTLHAEGSVDGEGRADGDDRIGDHGDRPGRNRRGPRVFSFGNGVRLVYAGRQDEQAEE